MTGLCYLMKDKDDVFRIRNKIGDITQKLLEGSKILAVGDNVLEVWEKYQNA